METFKGKITEFVDWITGIDSLTGSNVTDDLQVSGGSIRQLIQEKLKKPFYMYEDITNNKYRMFSSEEAYLAWKEDPIENEHLELFNFVRPSDYKLELTATDSDGFNNKFIRQGDINSIGSRIAFHWNIYNDEGDSSDSLSVKYTITNSSSGLVNSFTRWYNRSDADPNFSIYEYLQEGENVVSIEAKGSTTGARNTRTFTIVLLNVSVTSTFRFYDKFTPSQTIQIPYVFERNNTSGTAKIHFRIDGGGSGLESTRDVVQDGPVRVVETIMLQPTLSEGQHSLQIWAETKYNDGQTTVNSNLLYYTFTVASSIVGSTNKFINIANSFDTGDFPFSDLMLQATQYESTTINWSYYTDSLQTNTSIPVTWKLLRGLDDETPIVLGDITANNQERAATLTFVPTIYTEEGISTYVAAYFRNTLLVTLPIYILRNSKIKINETGFYETKMSCYGRTNSSSTKDIWTDETGNISTVFTNIAWNTNSGWYENSFRTVGLGEYATINAQPFSNFSFIKGKTIEIEFESEKVANDTDKLIVIGNPQGARIEITPDTATLYGNSNKEVVHTNYKANERIKLSFIINAVPENSQDRTVESGLAYIVNNGILERAAIASGQAFTTQGNIVIGNSESGVRVYTIRIYDYSITYSDAYNNFVFDSPEKAVIASRNDILNAGGEIDFDLCKNRIDTILITGNLSNILSGQTDKKDSTTDVTIERFCPFDASKNFKINNVQIRKHGQSTLNYPITSMKFWLNKSKSGVTPLWELTQQEDLLLNKNRYVMKSTDDQGKASIPANKFVLQANYADSSGVHNGSLQRIIQKTWFNANINGEYKLRTEPQLFATNQLVHHNDGSLNETDENTWVEGYGQKKIYDSDGNITSVQNVQWNDVTDNSFPYNIRIAPDSFPCAVFYFDEQGAQKRIFLGQYVFMDDKKSDYTYGERSIYAVAKDPFCLTTPYKSFDTKQNRRWDNSNVLRIEVLSSNTQYSSYMIHDNRFEQVLNIEKLDNQGNGTGEYERMWGWEQAFELIFPDEDDILKVKDSRGNTVTQDKFSTSSNFYIKTKPFVDFHAWVVSTYGNQQKFQREAAQHLDLYKMAAYYIFCMRFGLVDSLERNAQIKTYDGIHWHYEPWDMDIALGNKNDGGIAYDPPIDRNTKLPGSITTYAFSGRSADNNGNVVTSNWLWDALENWSYWINNVVPTVADALYNAGLTYDNISKLFDEEYASAWCELMYNKSGFFKYIESGNGDPTWLSWLQGSRMTHRHWWLSNSMDYYDAKWFCGEYKSHYIYIRANVTEGSNQIIRITPTKDTYMSIYKEGYPWGPTLSVSKNNIFTHNMGTGYGDLTGGSNTKNPVTVYGANFMEEIDLSEIALGFDGVTLDGAYSEVLGSPIKRINVGIITSGSGNTLTGTVAVLGCQIQASARTLANLQYLNIRGQQNQTDTNSFIYNNNLTELSQILALGSGLTNFYSSESGNTFSKIELPDTVYRFYVNNSSWNTLEFWNTEIGENNAATFTKCNGVPTTIHEISLLGTTGKTPESIEMVRSWLNNLVAEEADLSQYTLEMDKIDWREDTVGALNLLTYEELALIAQLNNSRSLKGYIVLRDNGIELTSQQLNNIKSWFGDTVFTKNSSGLVVDHKKNYVQINIGGNVIIDQLGGVTLEEGKSASLNATRFSLAEDDTTQYAWAIGPVGSVESYGRYKGLTVIQQESSVDGIAYITSTESNEGQDYDVQVTCSVEGVNYTTVIHVKAATYPTSQFINIENEGQITPRTVGSYIEFYQTGQQARFFVDTNDTYTGTINKITYSIKRNSDNTTVTYVDGGNGTGLAELYDDYITVTSYNNKHGVRIHCDAAMPVDDAMEFYTITAVTRFVSGREITATSIFIVSDDVLPIVQSNQVLYNPINDAFTTQFGSSIGRNYIYKIDLYVLNGTIDFTNYVSTLPNLVTANGTYLFKYLPNVTGIILDGFTSLTNTSNSIQDNDKTQVNFSNMISLETLSIKNCTGLTGNIDLTQCPDITEVYATGTNVNVFIPEGSKITNYEVGKPSSISIINPTVLTPEGIRVIGYDNLDSLDLINIPNNKSFRAFAKVMKSIGAEVMYNTYITSSGDTYNTGWNSTTPIYVPAGTSIKVSSGCYMNQYNENDQRLRGVQCNTTNSYQVDQYVNGYSYIRFSFTSNLQSFTVTNTSDGAIIFKYEA